MLEHCCGLSTVPHWPSPEKRPRKVLALAILAQVTRSWIETRMLANWFCDVLRWMMCNAVGGWIFSVFFVGLSEAFILLHWPQIVCLSIRGKPNLDQQALAGLQGPVFFSPQSLFSWPMLHRSASGVELVSFRFSTLGNPVIDIIVIN